MKRRHWLYAGVGAAAAAAGAMWRLRAAPPSPAAVAAAGASSSPAGAASAPEAALWSARFEQPDGQTLVMATLRGAPLVLNFWATWCPPCVKEMPELDRFAKAHAAQGVKVVGLAIDSPTPVRQFLQRAPVSYPIALAAFEGTDLTRVLGNDKGGLPFTAVFDRAGTLVQRKLGETSFDELARWVAALR